jgi:esterase/lipase
LIGVSLGGMIATEMGNFLEPEKIILISSAKCREELPNRYTFQRYLPIYKIIPKNITKRGAQILQPIVEPDRKHEKETFKSMLRDKEPEFLKRTVKMIREWERVDYRKDIIHIHGDNDKTIPVRNVNYDYLLKSGSHMMVLTRGHEISTLINKILLKK